MKLSYNCIQHKFHIFAEVDKFNSFVVWWQCWNMDANKTSIFSIPCKL